MTAAKYLELRFNSFITILTSMLAYLVSPNTQPVSGQPRLCTMSAFIFSTSGHTVGPMNISWVNEMFFEDSLYTQWFLLLKKIQEKGDIWSLLPRSSSIRCLEARSKGRGNVEITRRGSQSWLHRSHLGSSKIYAPLGPTCIYSDMIIWRGPKCSEFCIFLPDDSHI